MGVDSGASASTANDQEYWRKSTAASPLADRQHPEAPNSWNRGQKRGGDDVDELDYKAEGIDGDMLGVATDATPGVW